MPKKSTAPPVIRLRRKCDRLCHKIADEMKVPTDVVWEAAVDWLYCRNLEFFDDAPTPAQEDLLDTVAELNEAEKEVIKTTPR
jgi:hypothetical protein